MSYLNKPGPIDQTPSISGSDKNSRESWRENPTTRIPNSSVLLVVVTKTACAMDLGNRESYHRSAGVKTTGKKYDKKQQQNLQGVFFTGTPLKS